MLPKHKIIFSNGVFDVIHPGHINLLLYCRGLAGGNGVVVVALDSDKKVKKDKGIDRPIFSFEERSNVIKCLGDVGPKFKPLVDEIHDFNTDEELYNLIKIIKPDIIVKDSSWEENVIGADICKVDLLSRYREFSSTNIINRCRVKK